jgi:hypothetical protein
LVIRFVEHYRCGISQLTAAHFVGGHILGNVVIAKPVGGEICVKSDGSTGSLLTSDYLSLGLIFAFIVGVKS